MRDLRSGFPFKAICTGVAMCAAAILACGIMLALWFPEHRMANPPMGYVALMFAVAALCVCAGAAAFRLWVAPTLAVSAALPGQERASVADLISAASVPRDNKRKARAHAKERRAQETPRAEGHGDTLDTVSVKPKKRRWPMIIGIAAAWYALGFVLSLLGGGHLTEKELDTTLTAEATEVFGITVSGSVVICACIVLIVFVLALLFRLLIVPRFKDIPEGTQNAAEAALDALDSFVKGAFGHINDTLTCYMATIAVFLLFCAASELLALRAPSSDIVVTGCLAVITFVMINYYGIKKKGAGGRLKSLAQPMAFMFPFNLLSHIAVPVSLACRLFGNMLGGMIVMELVRSALGFYAMGPTALAGLFFNLFHPLIQVYIFITLSLTFINEAVE